MDESGVDEGRVVLSGRPSPTLPLREARELFEREYLLDADQPLRRQHLAHRGLRGDGAVGAAPQAEVAGRGDRLKATPRLVYAGEA